MTSKQLRNHAELCRRLADKFDAKEVRQALEESTARHIAAAEQVDLAQWHWSDNEPS